MLRLSKDGKVVLVRADQLAALERHQGTTRVILLSGSVVKVDETPEDIEHLLGA